MCTICFATQTFDPARHETFENSGFFEASQNGGAAAGSSLAGVPGTQGVGTVEEMALYLTEGYWGGQEYKFNTAASNVITINISGLTEAGQQLATWATEAWETLANLDFQFVTSGEKITVDDEFQGAYAYTPGGGAIPGGIEMNISEAWIARDGATINSYSFETYVHELGHALGLGHQGDYDGSVQYNTNSGIQFANDSTQMSVMSYLDQVENTFVDASFGYVLGPMMADIYAIQDLYGAPGAGSATAGNTVYGPGSNLGTYMDEAFTYLATGSDPSASFNKNDTGFALTIYDVGGTDTIDVSFIEDNTRLDLRERQFSDFGNNIGALGIAVGTTIENAVLGAGNDTVTGNAAANRLTLGGGRDTAFGGDGTDLLEGGDGGDSLHGGADNDTLFGGFGLDRLFGGAGNDTLEGDENTDGLEGGAGNDTLFGGQGFDNLFGEDGNDRLAGGIDADRLYGGAGVDTLFGGTNVGLKVDRLYGGDGNDTLYGDGGYDYLEGGDGADQMYGGNQADNLFGQSGDDMMYGGQGLDRLFGGAGDDTGFGGAGTDRLFGGNGHDLLYGGDANDRYFGGSGNDMLFGDAGNDTINGGSGFDTIDGGTGDDILFGRFNADTFVFADGHGDDRIGDFAAGNVFEKIDLSAISAISSLSDLQLNEAGSGAATQVNTNVIIDTGGGNSITLINVTMTDLDSTDFIF